MATTDELGEVLFLEQMKLEALIRLLERKGIVTLEQLNNMLNELEEDFDDVDEAIEN